MAEAIRIHTEVTGARPLGWYTGRSSIHSIDLAAEEGGFLYSSDAYADDLPYWINGAERAVPDHPLYARRQRHALRDAAGVQRRRPVPGLSDRLLRHALCRGRGRRAEDDVGRAPLPPRRPARAGGGARPFPRLCRGARTGSGCRGGSTSPGTGTPTTGRDRVWDHPRHIGLVAAVQCPGPESWPCSSWPRWCRAASAVVADELGERDWIEGLKQPKHRQ